MRTTAIFLVALLLAIGHSIGGDKKGSPPKDPAELLEWLPGTIWEIHSTTKHPAGEGYLMFREDGLILKLDADGKPDESRFWGVAPNMRVIWGRGNMRVMIFRKEFSEFIDSMYSTSGKRIEDPEIRKKFENFHSGKTKVVDARKPPSLLLLHCGSIGDETPVATAPENWTRALRAW